MPCVTVPFGSGVRQRHKFDLGITHAEDPAEWKRRYRKRWIAAMRSDPDYRAKELAQQALYKERRRERKRHRAGTFHTGCRPTPAPERLCCHYCHRGGSGTRLRPVERVVIASDGSLRPAKVLWCGQC
ncbi:MAG: hypothetical protein ACLP1Y_09035 [Candidatus Acidiferrales bacterium]